MSDPVEEELSIVLDRETGTYTAGELFRGEILVIFSEPVELSRFIVEIFSDASVSFTANVVTLRSGGESEPTTVNSNEKYTFARRSKNLLPNDSDISMVVARKSWHYRFSYQLPKNLPSSIEHEFGRIKYKVKAIFETRNQTKYVEETSFTIISTYDLNETPEAFLPIKEDKWKTFLYFCLFPWGRLHTIISVPSSGFVVGEVIPVTVYCDKNESRVRVTKIKVRLLKKLTFTALKPERVTRAVCTIEAAKKLEDPFNTSPNGLVTVELNLPELVPSSLKSCGIIKLDYLLEVEICFSGMHCSVVRRFPIFIGTVPLSKSFDTYNPSTVILPQPTAPILLEEPSNVPKVGRSPSLALAQPSKTDAPSSNDGQNPPPIGWVYIE